MIDGQAVSQSATASLKVTALSTTFLGRTVVDDAQQEPIAGVTVKFLGTDDKGNATGCSGQTVSDGAGNFLLTNLPAACVGPQLISYNGMTATAPACKYAGVNLSYTLVSGQVTASPVLVHLPRIDNAETVQVQQNASTDQTNGFRQYLNPAAYGAISTARFGTSGRNSVRGPGFFNLDSSLVRSFPVYKEAAVALQADVFNVTNTPQFANPTANISAGGFGVITTSNCNRTMRLSGRITF